uniref:Uncharacterized protein n=1 Tax=Anguilla anguilla TaxID=7936 RepID=A0A0E9SZV3_ANGAN
MISSKHSEIPSVNL